MARKLPWAASANANKSKASTSSYKTPRPSKKVKTESTVKHEPAEKDSSPSAAESTKHNDSIPPLNDRGRTRLRDGRSLSTSPPPAPPPVELMRSGLDEDDIYMLVEDEFQTIAQSYTGHLHHAEYKRLMKLAREKNAEQQRAGMNSLGVERIPENVSGETKQRLKRELLKERQGSGLKGISGSGFPNGSGDEDSDEEAREAVLAREEKKVGDMWAGTALSGLMSWDHSQEKTSLKGLGQIAGETRASKGFGPTRRRDQQQGDEDVGETRERYSKRTDEQDKIRPIGRSGTKRQALTQQTGENKYTSGELLSTTSYAKPAVKQRNTSDNTAPSIRHETDSIKTETKKIKIESKPAKVVRSRYRSLIDSLDDFDEAAFEATQAAIKSESTEKPRSRDFSGPDREKRKRDRKDRLDEVPVFLI